MLSIFSSLGKSITNKMSVIDETNRTHYYRYDDTDYNGTTGIKNVVDNSYSITMTGATPTITALYTGSRNGRNAGRITSAHYSTLATPVNLYSNNQTLAFKFYVVNSNYTATNTINNYIFISKYNSNNSTNGYLHLNLVNSNLELSYTFINPSTLKTTLISNVVIGASRYYHFAMIRNGTTSIDFYIDGLLVTSIDNSSDYKIFNNSGDNQFYLGRNPSENSYYFTGFIDDLRLYSRALPASEIAVLRSSCLS